jgi:thymidine kinase
MNSKQQQALDIAIAGHNLVIIGPAGTGKSFLLRKIKDSLSSLGKSVKLCCSTGIACNIFDEASTIHSFLGLCDGRFDPDKINSIHNENAIYSFVDKHLNSTDCLIIDECS